MQPRATADWLSDRETAPGLRAPSQCLKTSSVVLEALSCGEAHRFALPDDRGEQVLLTLGRSRDSDIVLRDPTVSRRHAVLRCSRAAWSIERATGSRGSVIIGGSLLEEGESARLALGVPIVLGEAVLVLRSDGLAATPAPCQGPAETVGRSPAMLARLAGGLTIERTDVRLDGEEQRLRASAVSTIPPPPRLPSQTGPRTPLRDELRAFERSRILEALERFDGNQSRAARHLAMPRRTFVARLSELGLTRPRAKQASRDE